MKLNIYEVMEYGPTLTSNEEYGILITANGAYFNIWVSAGDGLFVNRDVVAVSLDKGFDGISWIQVIEMAERLLQKIIKQEDREELLACQE